MCEPGSDVSTVADILVVGPQLLNRFMVQTALKHNLMSTGDDFLDQLMSDRG